MPSTISAECTSFVQKYGPMIINILISEGDPKRVCTLIKLCTSTVKKTLPRPFVSGILLRGEPIFNKSMLILYLHVHLGSFCHFYLTHERSLRLHDTISI